MKTLIIKSETPEQDRKAAFTIMNECQDEDLKRVVWYSDMGKSIAMLQDRFDQVDLSLEKRRAEMDNASKACLRAVDRIKGVEMDVVSLEQRLDALETKIKAQNKAKNPKKEKT